MTKTLSRRRFLASASILGAASLLPALPAFAAASASSLTIARRSIEVRGKSASVFGITAPDGSPGITLDPGQRFALSLHNRAGEPTIVHWHGQTPAPAEDGVTDTGYVGPIEGGTSRAYDFVPRTGTHWMHSHRGLQEQNLLAAPLIVRGEADLAADRQEVVVLLHDFSLRSPEEILASLGGEMGGMSGGGGVGMQGMAGGMMGGMPGMDGMDMGGMGGMDLNDVEYDAFLANDRTLDDPQVVRTEAGGRVLLRLINGASSTAFWIDLGSATGTLVAVDGNPVAAVEGSYFPLAQAQRMDILVTVPATGAVPVLARREGDRAQTGVVLAAPGAAIRKIPELAETAASAVDLSLESHLSAESPLAPRAATVTRGVMLMGSMMPYQWSIDGRTWQDRAPLRVRSGDRVVLEMWNHSMMAHPMHLHGHHFQVVGINGTSIAGAVRDTVLVPPMNRVAIAFDADNPGRWLFHCHNLYHMATGMMTELVYDDV